VPSSEVGFDTITISKRLRFDAGMASKSVRHAIR
jgi:hypothetical protein